MYFQICNKSHGVDIQKELKVLKLVGSHPNLLQFVAQCEGAKKIVGGEGACFDIGFVLPLYTGGNLGDYVKANRKYCCFT